MGTTDCLPFGDGFFEYLLSWNSCYYMSQGKSLEFGKNVSEISRVLKRGGWLICSIPKKSSFIFKNSKSAKKSGYRIIAKDPWGKREGEIMRYFESREEILSEFNDYFSHFCHSDIDMKWFGLDYNWHIFVAKKKY